MKLTDRLMPLLIGGVLVAGVGILISQALTPQRAVKVAVIVPKLSAMASEGEVAFNANCAKCHGVNGAGTALGPPLINDIYNPGHHGDAAFFRAAKRGVRQHHWGFGNMPSRPGVSQTDMTKIIRYVRELQEANGIFSRPHNM